MHRCIESIAAQQGRGDIGWIAPFYYFITTAYLLAALTPAAAIISSGLLHVERHLALTLVVTVTIKAYLFGNTKRFLPPVISVIKATAQLLACMLVGLSQIISHSPPAAGEEWLPSRGVFD
jgi:hypothetical protein